jgi:hypothetical protein
MNHWSLPDLCFLWIHFYFMNYKKIYDQICERAKIESDIRIQNRKLWKSSKGSNGIYYESHHIIPLCLGGNGKAFQWKHPNIVLLTAREHFICHWLLHEIDPNNIKLTMAFWGICDFSNKGNQQRYTVSSRVYRYLREANSKVQTGIPRSEEVKIKMRKPRTTTEKMKGKRQTSICPHCNLEGGNANMKRWHFDNCLKHPYKNNKRPKSKLKNRIMTDAQKIKLRGKRPTSICPHCNLEGAIGSMNRWHFDNCKSLKI